MLCLMDQTISSDTKYYIGYVYIGVFCLDYTYNMAKLYNIILRETLPEGVAKIKNWWNKKDYSSKIEKWAAERKGLANLFVDLRMKKE